jgi:hypothetical protein
MLGRCLAGRGLVGSRRPSGPSLAHPPALRAHATASTVAVAWQATSVGIRLA